MLDCEIVYRIEVDGILESEEYPSVEKAMEGAHRIFQADHSLKLARLFKYTKVFMGMEILNKDYGKTVGPDTETKPDVLFPHS